MAFPYSPEYTATFEACCKRHRDKLERLRKLIEKILTDPRAGGHHLKKKDGVDLYCRHARHLNPNFVVAYAIKEDEKRVCFLAFEKHDIIYSKVWPIGPAGRPSGFP